MSIKIRKFNIQYYHEVSSKFIDSIRPLFPHLVKSFKISGIHGVPTGGARIYPILSVREPSAENVLKDAVEGLFKREGLFTGRDNMKVGLLKILALTVQCLISQIPNQ